MPIELFTLGMPRVEVDGAEVGNFRRQKLCCAVLLFIGVERALSRERIVNVFWPRREADAARHLLSQTMYEIRQELPEDPFVVEGDRIGAAGNLTADVSVLEAAVAGDRPEEACSLYQGGFLEGVRLWRTDEWEEWVESHRLRLAGLHRKARRRLVARLQPTAAAAESLAMAREWVNVEPLDDEANQFLIDCLVRSGQRTEALRLYDRYVERLRRELDVEPLDELRELVERIRTGDHPAIASAPSSVPAMRDARMGDTPADRAESAEPGPPGGGDREAVRLHPALDVIRLIGKGSVATVHLAREIELRRLVAVKVLSDDLAHDETARRRFEREAEAAARIHHPNVVPVYRIGRTSSGAPFITMPWVKGGSLAERLEAWGAFDFEEARQAMGEVAAGLMAAHRIGIIHRDVRPANVLYDHESGRNLLCDFGIATVLDEVSSGWVRLTRTGEWIGNPSCISPEQLLGQPVTEKTDVYGLGTLAFELLAGRGPFDAANPAEFAVAHVRTAPLRLDDITTGVPDRIRALIGRCLAKRPEHRPGLDEILSALSL